MIEKLKRFATTQILDPRDVAEISQQVGLKLADVNRSVTSTGRGGTRTRTLVPQEGILSPSWLPLHHSPSV